MSKQFIKDLKIGSRVQTELVVIDVKELSFSAPSKAGDFFLKLQLGDVSGTIKGIIWDRSMVTEPLRPDDIIYVSGEVNEYQGPQLVISCYEKLDRRNVNRDHFQASCNRDRDEMWEEMISLFRSTVKDVHINQLFDAFLSDEHLAWKFKLSPAARVIHHNYLGGLLEHTLEVMELAREISRMYPERINPSLLMAGALFHDIGKIEEYDLNSFSFLQTDRGRLLGHITMGVEIVRDLINKIAGFPPQLQTRLEHILISHHGEKEWGSPEIPLTFTAFALFHADLLSARLKQFDQVLEKNEDRTGEWTEWDAFLGRKIYVDSYEVHDRKGAEGYY